MDIEEAKKMTEKFVKLTKTKEYQDDRGWSGYYNSELKELGKAIETVLKELDRQKEINEEHQKENGELREENILLRKQLNSAFDNGFIHKDKIKAIVEKLKREETICEEKFDNLWKKDNLSDYEKIKKGFLVDMQQEIGAIKGMLEELLED